MKRIELFTDGACSGNPGPGGWGALLKYGEHEKELSGYEPETTNNRMELMAAIMGLRAIKEGCVVDLTTDSKYVKQGMTEWIDNWRKKGWKNSQKKPVKNADLWMELDEEVKRHTVHWHWVKGHSGHEGNERADELATSAIEQNRQEG